MFGIVVTATWNGTVITGPVLIYHDEILADAAVMPRVVGDINALGALVCTSSMPRVGWRRTDHVFFGDGVLENELSQTRTGVTVVPNRARLARANENVDPSTAFQNGLWCCRISGDSAEVMANLVFVGVYRRGMGEY